MAAIIIPTTDALNEPTVMRALRKLVAWATHNFQKIADNQDVIAIDNQMSNSSENPVQNKVITETINSAVTTMETTIDEVVADIGTELQTKVDKDINFRKIIIGTDEIPCPNVGEEGDIYIYMPTE